MWGYCFSSSAKNILKTAKVLIKVFLINYRTNQIFIPLPVFRNWQSAEHIGGVFAFLFSSSYRQLLSVGATGSLFPFKKCRCQRGGKAQRATLDQLARGKKKGKREGIRISRASYEWRRHRSHSFDWTSVEWLEYETLTSEKGSRSPVSSDYGHWHGTPNKDRRGAPVINAWGGVMGWNWIATLEEPAAVSMTSRGKLS